MSQPANLSDFISKVKTEGLLSGSHFHVTIGGSVLGEFNLRDVMMLCEATSIPGLNHMTTELRTFGESREVPYGATYQPIEFSFILDHDLRVKQYFEDWMNLVFDRRSRMIGYRLDYIREIGVYLSDKKGNIVHKVTLHECYPKILQDIALDFSQKDPLKLRVSIVFKYWETSPVDVRGNPNDSSALSVIKSFGGDSLDFFSKSGLTVLQDNNLIETLGSLTGLKTSGEFSSFGLPSELERELSVFGPLMGSDMSRSCGAFYGLTSSIPNIDTNTGTLGSSIFSLGRSGIDLGGALGSLGDGMNSVLGVIGPVGTAASSMAGTLGAVNSALSSLGLGSPLSGVIGGLTTVAGKIAVVGNAAGVPGHIKTIGANVGATGAIFTSITKSIESIPNGTKAMSDAMGKIGEVFTKRGETTTNFGSQMETGMNLGYWQ